MRGPAGAFAGERPGIGHEQRSRIEDRWRSAAPTRLEAAAQRNGSPSTSLSATARQARPKRRHGCIRLHTPTKSMTCGFRFPAEVILWAVRWYLQFPISYRDLE